MDIRYLTENFAVSPQISAEDVTAIAADGFKKIICNRPDSEVSELFQAKEIRQAAESLGLEFEVRPLTRDTLNSTQAQAQRASAAQAGKAFAYCASGTRCTLLWAIGERGHLTDDQIVAMAAQAGYDLRPLWPIIDQA